MELSSAVTLSPNHKRGAHFYQSNLIRRISSCQHMAVITGRHRLTFPPGPSNRMMPHWNVLES